MVENSYNANFEKDIAQLLATVNQIYDRIINSRDGKNLKGAEKEAYKKEIFKQRDIPACFAYIVNRLLNYNAKRSVNLLNTSISNGTAIYLSDLCNNCFDEDTLKYIKNHDLLGLHILKLDLDAKSDELVRLLSPGKNREKRYSSLRQKIVASTTEDEKKAHAIAFLAGKSANQKLLSGIHTNGRGEKLNTIDEKLKFLFPGLDITLAPTKTSIASRKQLESNVLAFKNAYNKFMTDPKIRENAIQTLKRQNLPPTDEAVNYQLLIDFGKTRAFKLVYKEFYSDVPEISSLRTMVKDAKVKIRNMSQGLSKKLNELVLDETIVNEVKNWFLVNYNLPNPTDKQIATIIIADITKYLKENDHHIQDLSRSFISSIDSRTPSFSNNVIKHTFALLGYDDLTSDDIKEIKATARKHAKVQLKQKPKGVPTVSASQQKNIINKVCNLLQDDQIRSRAEADLKAILKSKPHLKMSVNESSISGRILDGLRAYNHSLYVTISDSNIAGLGVGSVHEKLKALGFNFESVPKNTDIVLENFEKANNNDDFRKPLLQKAYSAGYDVDLSLENSDKRSLNNKPLALYLINKETKNLNADQMRLVTEKLGLTELYQHALTTPKASLKLNEGLVQNFLAINSKIRLSSDGKILNPESIDMLTSFSRDAQKAFNTTRKYTVYAFAEDHALTQNEIDTITKTGKISGIHTSYAYCNQLRNLATLFNGDLDYTIGVLFKRNRDLGSKTTSRLVDKIRLTDKEIETLRKLVDQKFKKYTQSKEFLTTNKNKPVSFEDRYKAVIKYIEICQEVYNENVGEKQEQQ